MRVRRLLPVLIVVAAVSAGAALAASPVLTDTYDGPTKHKRFTVELIPQCFTAGCKHATTIAVQVLPKHGSKKCPAHVYQLPSGRLKNGKFSASGEFIVKGKTLTFKATGHFTKPNQVSGKLTVPKACGGGSDTYSFFGVPE